MHLEPRDTERHHDIRDRVRLREHILDLLARVDVPLGHMLLVHGGFHFLGQSLALSDGFHRLERQLGLDALQDQVVHNIVSAADTAGQRNALADQLCGIAEPNIRAVRQTGNRNQLRERRWVRLLYHAAHELGSELGHRHTAEVTEDRVGIRVFALVLKRLA